MAKTRGVRKLVQQLELIRGEFTATARAQKLELLRQALSLSTLDRALLKRLHSAACFLWAFPDDSEVHAAARSLLRSFPGQVAALGKRRRRQLDESGMAGSTLCHEFGFDMASWLDRRFGGQVEIAWDRFESPDLLDDLLAQLLTDAEELSWEESAITTRNWIRLAKGDATVTDLSWLLQQIRSSRSGRSMLVELYSEAEVSLQWRLGNSSVSKTFNTVPWLAQAGRRTGWRKPAVSSHREIVRPVDGVKRLSGQKAMDVIDVARAALATRHREVHALTYANPQEVYLAPVGQGVHVAVMGVLPEQRLSIEGNFGYVILSHGVPIGYGGASPLFAQANTGVSMFEEYRRGESRYLFLQVLRVMRTLFRTELFIANPYQFGLDNDDALASGAFWFYYKLGFRPADPAIRRRAQKVAPMMRRRPPDRPDGATMKALCATDLHLRLAIDPSTQLFLERWLAALGRATTRRIAQQGIVDRRRAIRVMVSRVATTLSVPRWREWAADERRAFERLAPILDAIPTLARWSPSAKRGCVALIRAKGGTRERDYVRLLARNKTLFRALWDLARSEEAT